MYIVTFVILSAIFLVLMDDRRLWKQGFVFSGILVALFFSLRYNYGNDYMSYAKTFNDIANSPSLSMAYEHVDAEKGWILLCWMLKPLGTQSIFVVHTVALVAMFYWLIYKYVKRGYRAMAVTFFLIHPNLFILDLSMMRQSLAAALFVWAVILMTRKKEIWAVVLTMIGFSLHKSAIVTVPFLLAARFYDRLNYKITAVLAAVLFAYLMMNPLSVADLLLPVMSDNTVSDEYGNYFSRGAEAESYGMGFIMQVLAVIPAFLCLKHYSKFDIFLLMLYFVSLVIVPFYYVMVMIGRFSSYFLPFGVLLFPRCYTRSVYPSKRFYLARMASLGLMLIYIVVSYWDFFKSPTYGAAFSTWHYCF